MALLVAIVRGLFIVFVIVVVFAGIAVMLYFLIWGITYVIDHLLFRVSIEPWFDGLRERMTRLKNNVIGKISRK